MAGVDPRVDVDPDMRLAAVQTGRERAHRLAGRFADANDPVGARDSLARADLARDRIARKHWPRDRDVGTTELLRTCVRRSDHLEAVAYAARWTRSDDVPRAFARGLAFAASTRAAGVREVCGARGFDASVAASEETIGAVGAREIQSACFALRGRATRTFGCFAPDTSFAQPAAEASALARRRGQDERHEHDEAPGRPLEGHAGSVRQAVRRRSDRPRKSSERAATVESSAVHVAAEAAPCVHRTSFVLPPRSPSSWGEDNIPSSSDPLGGEALEYVAFEDDRGEVTKMAALKPGSVPPSSLHTPKPAGSGATVAGFLREADPEITVTRQFDPSSASSTVKVDADIDWSDSSTLARGLDDEPQTLSRPSLAVHEVETRRQLDVLDTDRSKPIIEDDVSTPVVDTSIVEKDISTPILENEVATLTKAARELETIPRDAKKLVLDHGSDNTAATLVRRDSIPPPALPPPLPPPFAAAGEPPATVRGAPAGLALQESSSATGAAHAKHTGSVPWVTSMPAVDPTPPAAPAIPTPLVMVSPVEDNLTRVAPLAAPPLVLHRLPTPIPYPQLPPATRLPLQHLAFAGAALFLVAVLALVAVRPRTKVAAAGPAKEPKPVAVAVVEAPPPVALPLAGPPAAPETAPAPATATATASVSTPAPPPTARPSALRRRHLPAKPAGHGSSRPHIPLRREP